MGIKS